MTVVAFSLHSYSYYMIHDFNDTDDDNAADDYLLLEYLFAHTILEPANIFNQVNIHS